MNYQNEDDYFAFTKQTAMILEGLGIGDLIPQFKYRNISTQALSQLSKDDFITLGVPENMADSIVKQLSSRVDKHKLKMIMNTENNAQFRDIIKIGIQQLSYIQAFITYSRLKLSQTPVDYIIDPNCNKRATEALCEVANCTIEEINNFEEILRQMSTYLSEDGSKKKQSKSRFFTIIKGIGVSICLIYSLKCIVMAARRC
ncbi:hypothetical protein PV327_000537 [Microctonus hyperodae]|uniref:SAM domain-containing protein n=1 Tax=Microctonus hyperodae TaxID=165561 RepID=A0AA39L229_MICHY|nr:hypothetical protein PV327_000537 [Microctonus hyperodae]